MASSLEWTWSAVPWQAMGAPPSGRPSAVATMPADTTAFAELTEAALVEACLAGRPGAFDVIVERHRRPIYQLCYRFVGNHEDANDLSQDVFLRAYRGLRSFRNQASIATWLYRIGVNVCLNRVNARTTLGKLTDPIADRQFADHGAMSASDTLLK